MISNLCLNKKTIHESPRQWRGKQDTGSQTRARHTTAVLIPSTCAIEPWLIRPTVTAQIERVSRGGTANSCLDQTCECDTRRGNEPESDIDQLIYETRDNAVSKRNKTSDERCCQKSRGGKATTSNKDGHVRPPQAPLARLGQNKFN